MRQVNDASNAAEGKVLFLAIGAAETCLALSPKSGPDLFAVTRGLGVFVQLRACSGLQRGRPGDKRPFGKRGIILAYKSNHDWGCLASVVIVLSPTSWTLGCGTIDGKKRRSSGVDSDYDPTSYAAAW